MNKKQRENFFYAETAAGMYDITIDLVVPYYEAMHDMVIALLRASRLPAGAGVLDIGSGTGTDSIAILQQFPDVEVLAIDLCRPIQEVHRQKLDLLDNPEANLRARCHLICADVLTDLDSESSIAALAGWDKRKRCAAVVSSLVIHHFSHKEKQQVYDLVSSLLPPGGIFINADLFSYADAKINRIALDFDLAWMRKGLLHPSQEFPEAANLSKPQRTKLLERWVHHYKHANRLEPIEDTKGRREKLGQNSMLLKAGFRHVAIPYRMSLSGVIFATK